jgi:plastocyanin
MTMTSSGISPASVTITAGQSVTFVNNDSVSHYPLTSSGDASCASASTGTIAAGQTKLSVVFSSAATCVFYDYLNPSDARFQGTITIH